MSGAGLATILLAAGAGSRFGGVKQFAELEGRPILSRVMSELQGVGETQVLVLGAAAERVREAIPAGSWNVVVAADWEDGPGASLRAGLAAAAAAESALIVLGDLAWLRREAAERVLAAAAASPRSEAVRACEGGRPGHPLLIRGALLDAARVAPDAGLRPLLEQADVLAVDCAGLGPCRDVDTPDDLDPAAGHSPAAPTPKESDVE